MNFSRSNNVLRKTIESKLAFSDDFEWFIGQYFNTTKSVNDDKYDMLTNKKL